jgi:hypothetical protein
MQFVLFVSQEAVQLLSQEQDLVRGERKQQPLAGLILHLKLVRAALSGRRDAGEDLGLQSTRHGTVLVW